jgi:hypothetical protein
MEKNKSCVGHGDVNTTQHWVCFCISFLVFNYENILIFGDSKVGSHL